MLAGTALSGPLTPPSGRSTNGQCDSFGTMRFPVMSGTVPHILASVHLAQWFVISISSIRGDCTRHAIGSEHCSVQGLFTFASGYFSVLLMEESLGTFVGTVLGMLGSDHWARGFGTFSVLSSGLCSTRLTCKNMCSKIVLPPPFIVYKHRKHNFQRMQYVLNVCPS